MFIILIARMNFFDLYFPKRNYWVINMTYKSDPNEDYQPTICCQLRQQQISLDKNTTI